MTTFISDDELRAACKAAVDSYRQQPGYKQWLTDLTNHLIDIQSANHDEFVSEEFQRRLWDSEAVSATGMGNINVSQVVKNKSVAEYLWYLKTAVLPVQPSERVQFLINAWEECGKLIAPLVKRSPKLKMYRVFAALKPTEFSTVAHGWKLWKLAGAMGLLKAGSRDHPIVMHRSVLDRLAEILGPVKPAPELDGVERMTLPWHLYVLAFQEQGDEAAGVMGAVAGSEQLNPLPAERRRRGLLAIRGFFPSIRSMIEFAKDGCTREDFREHIRSINPNLADVSLGTNLNALIAEWGVLRASGNNLSLTQRGEALLESGDPEEVSDWLLTRVLGFDNTLVALKDSPASVDDLVTLLQKVNPGWTSSFAPKALINWIRSLGLAELDANKNLRLTEDGRTWADRIHWTPEKLPASIKADGNVAVSSKEATSARSVNRPALSAVISDFPSSAVFASSLIARLDAALWHHERRHFAVLTGLSGAGKTLLARSYGLALSAGFENREDGLYTVPVQPGWHDPSSILGYVNPLSGNTYAKTGFLEFLLRAAGDPKRPYTVVLDEMNLSHPEQYLAPLLSAMETGDDIELHTFEDEISGIPPSIPYPSNLVLIGTVNMDETTHGLSDKVLDRASVIEFWDVDVKAYPGWSSSDLAPENISQIRDVLTSLGNALRPVRLHFGWRTIGDILGQIQSAHSGGVLDSKTAFDHAIYSKVLPKLRGEDTPRLRDAFAEAKKVLQSAGLTASQEKLSELEADLKFTGSARFWR